MRAFVYRAVSLSTVEDRSFRLPRNTRNIVKIGLAWRVSLFSLITCAVCMGVSVLCVSVCVCVCVCLCNITPIVYDVRAYCLLKSTRMVRPGHVITQRCVVDRSLVKSWRKIYDRIHSLSLSLSLSPALSACPSHTDKHKRLPTRHHPP